MYCVNIISCLKYNSIQLTDLTSLRIHTVTHLRMFFKFNPGRLRESEGKPDHTVKLFSLSCSMAQIIEVLKQVNWISHAWQARIASIDMVWYVVGI